MAEMLPVVMNENFERLAIIDDYISFIWATRYYEPGDFELCVNISREMRELLKENYYIARDDADEIAVIEKVRVEKDLDDKDILIASGRFVSSILGRRIIADEIQVSGTVAQCVKKLMDANAVSPSIAARKLPFVYGTFSNAPLKMSAQYTGKNLLETIVDICKTYGCGFKTTVNEDHKFVFSMFDGVDRSYNQSANTYVVFSDDYENLQSSDYSEDYSATVTDVLVAGEGEGSERKKIWANVKTNSGLSRYEIFEDARNASTNNGEITDSVYFAQLKSQGLEDISEFTKNFAGQVQFDNNDYGSALNIGDICTIENVDWQISMNARLIEVIESTGETGEYTITPTFEEYSISAGNQNDTSGNVP